MHSCKARLEQIADIETLNEAFLRAVRGKRETAETFAFRDKLQTELIQLRSRILEENLELGRFRSFTIHEPKERRIHAPCFRERVLHHALLIACEGDFDRWLISDSFACRKGKGREAALLRAEHYAQRYPWFLKLDVRKYFDSIPHATLLARLERGFRDVRVFSLFERIVRSYEHSLGRGLPIGSLTSQHLANFYLGPADRFIKESLRLPGYVRYMDDMALWLGDQRLLGQVRRNVRDYLCEELGLELKDSWHLQPSWRGMNFLGYRVFPGGSQVNKSSRRRFVRRWRWLEQALERGELCEQEAQNRCSAMVAFLKVARQETILERLFGGLQGRRNGGWTIGHQPRQSRRQLEQLSIQLPLRQPQQERAGQPQQQPRLPPRPQLKPTAWTGRKD